MGSTSQNLERSNSTTAAFLRARQRAWMVSENRDTSIQDRSPSKPVYSPDSARASFGEDSSFMRELRESAQQVNSDRDLSDQAVSTVFPATPSDGAGRKVTVAIPSLGSASDQTGSKSTAHSRDLQLRSQNHLPSRSPNDDRTHESNYSAADHPIRSQLPSDPATAMRLEQLISKYGSVDEIEKHLLMVEGPTTKRQRSVEHESSERANSTYQPVIPFPAEFSSNQRAPSSATPSQIVTNTEIPNQDQQSAENSQERHKDDKRSAPHYMFWPSLNAAFAKFQRGEASQFNELTRECTEAISNRILIVSTLGNRGHIERPRLDLLQDACCRSDYSFLMLHQLYCWADKRRANKKDHNIGQLQEQGLRVLKRPLAPNDDLPQDAINWFARFPGRLKTIVFSPWYKDTLQTLCQLALHWDGLQSSCSSRKFPPLASEMRNILQVSSVKLQEVIFRVMLRDIMKETDICFRKYEQIFLRNQQFVNEQLSRGDFTLRDDEFQAEHRKLWSSHLSHVQRSLAPSPSTAAPSPWIGQSVIGLSDSRGNNVTTTSRQGAKSSSSGNVQNERASTSRSITGTAQAPAVSLTTSMSEHNNSHSLSFQTNHAPILVEAGQNQLYEPNFRHAIPSLESQSVPMPLNQTATYLGQSHHSQSTQNEHLSMTSNLGSGASAESHPLQQRQLVPISSARLNNPTQRSTQSPTEVLAASRDYARVYHNLDFQPHSLTYRGNQQQDATQILSSEPFIHIPTPGSQYALPEQSAPLITALHHARALSPAISTGAKEDCFGCVQNIFMAPNALNCRIRHQQYSVPLSMEDINALANDTYSVVGTAHARLMSPNSYTYRIKCVKSKLDAAMPGKQEWKISSHCWPPYVAILLNDQALEIRRKSHYVKDLPVDVTRIVKEGQNTLTMAIMNPLSDSMSDEQYFVGLEAIETLTQSQVKNLISSLDEQTARQHILSRTRIGSTDPDIELLHQDIVLNLTDPFSAQMFEIPVRGSSCTHIQCFDLDNFLRTRSGSTSEDTAKGPCNPDEFKCPICNGDVSPGNLVIDVFFKNIRAKLHAIGRLDVKAVTLGVDGEWAIKEEGDGRGQSSDGDSSSMSSQEGSAHNTAQTSKRCNMHFDQYSKGGVGTFTAGERLSSAERTVIELDD